MDGWRRFDLFQRWALHNYRMWLLVRERMFDFRDRGGMGR